jgi:chromosomal replication initiator protein
MAVRKYTMPGIAAVTAEIAGITVDDLKGPCRSQRMAWPRMVAMHIARADDRTTTMVAKFFNRDHATIVHATKTVAPLEQSDCRIGMLYRRIIERLDEKQWSLDMRLR